MYQTKSALLTIMIFFLGFTAFCQDFEIDKKSGLVTVDGKDMFYMVSKKHDLFTKDFSLQDLKNNELVFFTYTSVDKPRHYYDQEKEKDVFYRAVFTKSGSTCNIPFEGAFGSMKSLVKKVVAANLVTKNGISQEEERKFVTMYGGYFRSSAPEYKAAAIVLDGTKIFNGKNLIGSFKKIEAGQQTVITVYSTSGLVVCNASYSKTANGGDWLINVNGQEKSFLYDSTAPFEKLFAYLADAKLL
jgi:hypothetical protein